MAERIIPVTAEMFILRAEERSAKTNFQLARLLGETLGRGRLRLCRSIREGGVLPEDAAEEINTYVLESSKRRYRLPDSTDPQEFYMQQQKQALGVRKYYSEILPEVAQDLEGKDEISLLSDRPSDLVRLLFRPAESIDPILAYEAQQHVLLAHIAGMINARTLNGRLNTVLYDVHRLLNEKLFEGPEGAGQKIFSESFHDDESNQVVGFPNRQDQKLPTAHLKRIRFTVRRIRDLGLVYTSPRKKDDRISIVKCIAKSLDNGGVINIDHDIQDGIGLEFVIMEDHVTPRQLADQVVSVVESGSRKIDKVEVNDKKVENNRGQSPEFEFDKRLKIWFEDLPTPLEMTIFTLANYLNYILEVGTRDPKTGLYMGRAHPLYELRRARKVAHLIFRAAISPEDLDTAFINRSKWVAQDLRVRYKAA